MVEIDIGIVSEADIHRPGDKLIVVVVVVVVVVVEELVGIEAVVQDDNAVVVEEVVADIEVWDSIAAVAQADKRIPVHNGTLVAPGDDTDVGVDDIQVDCTVAVAHILVGGQPLGLL